MQASSLRQFCLYWSPPLLLTGGILLFSGEWGSGEHTKRLLFWLFSWFSLPELLQTEQTHGLLRKIAHVTVYGSLSWLWFRALEKVLSGRLKTAILFSLSLCLLIAFMDEGHQYLVPSREGRILDVALDFGAAALVALALLFKREYL